MVKQKKDYASLKQEFMQSDIPEVKWFLLSKSIPYDRYAREWTKWWTKEKKAMKQKIIQKAIEKRAEKEAAELSAKIPLERLYRMKWDFFDLIDQAIDWMQQKDNVDIEKVIKWLNAIKTELWEPTTVNKNENDNNNKDIIQAINISITPQDIDKLQKKD